MSFDDAKAKEQPSDSIACLADELDALDERLARYRGQEYIGIPQETLPELDKYTLGLRGLILLAGPPNIGKTSLGTQLGIDAVRNGEDVCFLFVSLEMSRWDIYLRIMSRLAKIDWRDMMLGKEVNGQKGQLSKEDNASLIKARDTIKEIGKRVKLLDFENFSNPTVERIVRELDALKKKSDAKRAVVLVDYLQVWQPPDEDKINRSDLALDKWQVGQMRKLRDLAGDGTAVIVVSEARKPSTQHGKKKTAPKEWGSSLADIMGAARASYTADMVLLVHKLHEEEDTESHERVPCILRIAKGRDGVVKGIIDLEFHTRQNYFAEKG